MKVIPNSIFERPICSSFFAGHEIIEIKKLPSLWRDKNIIIKIRTDRGTFVYKEIRDASDNNEVQKILEMQREYPSTTVQVFAFDQDSYIMEFLNGLDFFSLPKSERVQRLGDFSHSFTENCSRDKPTADISFRIASSFMRYWNTRAQYLEGVEAPVIDFTPFERVSTSPSHNDLNAANVIYLPDGSYKTIDPSDEGYNDRARDIGRYCASVFFNNYDRFGNDASASLEIAGAVLDGTNGYATERVRYYMGESFLSFLRFNTVSVPKTTLKNLAITTLTSDQPIIKCLEECL